MPALDADAGQHANELVFESPAGGLEMMSALYQCGVWAIVAGFDRAALQFKPGLLVERAYADDVLSRFESALRSVKARHR